MPQLGDVFHIVARGVQEAVCVIPFIVVVSTHPPSCLFPCQPLCILTLLPVPTLWLKAHLQGHSAFERECCAE